MSIPKSIFQTHKTFKYVMQHPQLKVCANSWLACSNEYNCYFFNDHMCSTFMHEHFDKNVIDAYNSLPMSVMKADLWRYCVIYINGGIYADADTILLDNPMINVNVNSQLVVTIENGDGMFFCQWWFAAPPKSPILKRVIDMCVERIMTLKVYDNEHIVHYLTGPSVFTDGIEAYLRENQLPTYNEKSKYVGYTDPCLTVLDPDIFHNKQVVHIFNGSNIDDGWKHHPILKHLRLRVRNRK